MGRAERLEVNNITQGVIWKQILRFFFPIVLGTFFQQLYNTVDAVVVGNFVGTAALAAVGGTTSTIINLLVGFFVGLSSGATVIISQFYGAQDHEGVSRSVHTAIALALAGGVLLTVLGLALAPQMLKLMNTPDDVLPNAIVYMRLYFIGVIPMFLYNIGSSILRAIGDSRRPLYILIVCCIVNIILDVFFVTVLEMGVAGVAVATMIAQLISAVLVVALLMRAQTSYKLFPKRIRFYGNLLSSIIKIGLPTGIQSMMYSISNLYIQASVNLYGTSVMAAWTALGKIDALFWMISTAFGIAATTFVGQNFGAGRFDRVKTTIRSCMLMEFIFAFTFSGLLYLFGRVLFRLFTSDAQVVENGMQLMLYMCPYYFTFVAIEVLSGAMRGIGNSLAPMIMVGTGICLLRVVWIFITSQVAPSIALIVYSYPVSWVVTTIMFLIYYFRGNWKSKYLPHASY